MSIDDMIREVERTHRSRCLIVSLCDGPYIATLVSPTVTTVTTTIVDDRCLVASLGTTSSVPRSSLAPTVGSLVVPVTTLHRLVTATYERGVVTRII